MGNEMKNLMRKLILLSVFFYSFLIASNNIIVENPIHHVNLKSFPNGPVPKPIKVAIFVDDIIHINEEDKVIDATIHLIISWDDERLIFNHLEEGAPKKIYLYEDADLKIKEIWNPKIEIKNLIKKDSLTERSLTIYENGHVIQREIISGKFKVPIHTKSYPFDKQSFNFDIVSQYITSYDMELVQEMHEEFFSGSSLNFSIKGWKPESKDLLIKKSQIQGIDRAFYPLLRAEVNITRNSLPICLKTFLPFLLILSAPSFILFVGRADLAPVMASILTSILALVALNFSQGLSLKFLDANNLINRAFNLGFFYQFLLLSLTVTIFNPKLSSKISSKFMIEEITKFISWFLPFLLLGILLLNILLAKYNLEILFSSFEDAIL